MFGELGPGSLNCNSRWTVHVFANAIVRFSFEQIIANPMIIIVTQTCWHNKRIIPFQRKLTVHCTQRFPMLLHKRDVISVSDQPVECELVAGFCGRKIVRVV